MRVISGDLKGKKISLPDDKKTRPLRDLVKESIFNLIEHSNKFSLKLIMPIYLIYFQVLDHLELNVFLEMPKK